MKQCAIIGIGQFGKCMLESLVRRRFDVLVIDQSEEKIQWARDLATKAVRADVLNYDLFKELLPEDLPIAIIDLGDHMERSILVANYLHKLGVQQIIVEAVNAEHAEILEIVGATRIVYPELEAAERLAGLLAGQGRLDYFPVSDAFSLVEILAPQGWAGKTLVDLNLPKTAKVMVVASRKSGTPEDEEAWNLLAPNQPIARDDVMLVAGSVKDIERVLK